jgi:hypothetical protein
MNKVEEDTFLSEAAMKRRPLTIGDRHIRAM